MKYKVLIFQDQPRHVRWSASRAEGGPAYRFVYVDQEGYARNPPQTLCLTVASFTEYQTA